MRNEKGRFAKGHKLNNGKKPWNKGKNCPVEYFKKYE